jgi:uncharacterized tellurite resistance protein B-like protein
MVCIQTIFLQLPHITFDDWRKLKIYLAYPISVTEQKAIVEDFVDKVYSKGHSSVAWSALIEIVKADGIVNSQEKEFIFEMEDSLLLSTSSFLKKLRFFLLGNSITQQSAWSSPQKGRDKFIHEFYDNPIYFLFRKEILKESVEIKLSKLELQKICLLSAILCFVAAEDGNVDLTEQTYIHKLLSSDLQIDSDVAHLIIRVAMNIEINELKLRELCKSLLLSVQDNEAQKILQENEIQSMFLLIAKLISIDGEIKVGELELLRTIALYLDINRKVWAESILNFKS